MLPLIKTYHSQCLQCCCILTVVLPLVLQLDAACFSGIESDNFCVSIMSVTYYFDNDKLNSKPWLLHLTKRHKNSNRYKKWFFVVYYYHYIHLIYILITIYLKQQKSGLNTANATTNHSCLSDDKLVCIYFHFDYGRNAFLLYWSLCSFDFYLFLYIGSR